MATDTRWRTTVLPRTKSSKFMNFPNTTWKNASNVCLNLSAHLLLAYNDDIIRWEVLPRMKTREFIWVSVKDYGLNCRNKTGMCWFVCFRVLHYNIYTRHWLPLEPFWTNWLHTPMNVNWSCDFVQRCHRSTNVLIDQRNVQLTSSHGYDCSTLWPNKLVNNFSVPHSLHN